MSAVGRVRHLSHGFAVFLAEALRSRRLITDLTRREVRGRYLGSAFGLTWTLLNPIMLMGVFFVVFTYGIPQGPVDGVPFLPYLFSGLLPWFLIADCLGGSVGVVIENKFLVKKVVFRVSLLPIVRILGQVPIHLAFVTIIVGMYWAYGYPPSWYTLQLLYYMLAMMAFGVGWCWLVSSIAPFFKDVLQMVPVLLQVLFYLTPIIWRVPKNSPRVEHLMDLNPMYYIVKGYQQSLLTPQHVPIWHHPLTGLYFWLLTLMLTAVGGMVFLRLRPHFADVL